VATSVYCTVLQSFYMDREGEPWAVTRLRVAVLIGAALGFVVSSAVVGAVEVSVDTAAVELTNDGEQTREVTVVSFHDGERVERTLTVEPGETVRPVQFLENGEYAVTVYADGQLCSHMSAQVAGADALSAGTVTTTGNSLTDSCETDVGVAPGATVRAD
jgi:hypothetical protein